MTPNVRRLVSECTATIQMKKVQGEADPILATVHRIAKSNGKALVEDLREGVEFVRQSIAAVRAASDADPAWTDEDIAGEILIRLKKERK